MEDGRKLQRDHKHLTTILKADLEETKKKERERINRDTKERKKREKDKLQRT